MPGMARTRYGEWCLLCGWFYPAYGRINTPGGVLNHYWSSKRLNLNPSATKKKINFSAMKFNIDLLSQAMDGRSVQKDCEKLPPCNFSNLVSWKNNVFSSACTPYVVKVPNDRFFLCGCLICEHVVPPASELFLSGFCYASDVSAQSKDFWNNCPCVIARCVSWGLIHGSVGQVETFSGVLFPFLVKFEFACPDVL